MNALFSQQHPFLKYAGIKAPEGMEETDFKNPVPAEIEGKPFYVIKGHLIPCYFPRSAPQQENPMDETMERMHIVQELARRIQDVWMRGSDISPTYAQLQHMEHQFETEQDPIKKPYRGMLFIGGILQRVESLAGAILQGKGDEPFDKPSHHGSPAPEQPALSAREEFKQHSKTLAFIAINKDLAPGEDDPKKIEYHDLMHSLRLRGNKEDIDGVVAEMLTDFPKAAMISNGHALPLSSIHENRVQKIGVAIQQMDQINQLMQGLLERLPDPDGALAPLKENVHNFTLSTRTRVAIRRGDLENYVEAEVEHDALREKVDKALHSILEERKSPEEIAALQLVKKGRSLINDICYVRQGLDTSFKHYQDAVEQAMSRLPDAREPDTRIAGSGVSAEPAIHPDSLRAARSPR